MRIKTFFFFFTLLLNLRKSFKNIFLLYLFHLKSFYICKKKKNKKQSKEEFKGKKQGGKKWVISCGWIGYPGR
jgi:hypothetical protein